MSNTAEFSKLAELRVKTDRELVRIIEGELERGLRLALIGPGPKIVNHFDSTKPPHASAAKAYADAVKLLPKVDDMTERGRLQSKLKQLREALDRVSAPDESRVQAAYS